MRGLKKSTLYAPDVHRYKKNGCLKSDIYNYKRANKKNNRGKKEPCFIYRTYVKRCSHLRHILNVWHFRRCLTLFFLLSLLFFFFQNSMYMHVYENVFNAFFRVVARVCVYVLNTHIEYVLWVSRTGKCRLYRMHTQSNNRQGIYKHTLLLAHITKQMHTLKTFTNYRGVVVVGMCICAWIFVCEAKWSHSINEYKKKPTTKW